MSVGVGALDDPNIVGDDILGVPFIKISVCLKGPSGTPVPTGFGENFDILLVGEDINPPVVYKNIIAFCADDHLASRKFASQTL